MFGNLGHYYFSGFIVVWLFCYFGWFSWKFLLLLLVCRLLPTRRCSELLFGSEGLADIVNRLLPVVELAAEKLSLWWALGWVLGQQQIVLVVVWQLDLYLCSIQGATTRPACQLHRSFLFSRCEVFDNSIHVQFKSTLLLHVKSILLE